MSAPYIGEIRMAAFNFAPKDWALCNGQILQIQQYSPLFSIIGTTYGGNGITTFALPNLQSRIPVGWGQGPGLSYVNLGEIGGVEGVSLTSSQIPAHTHAVRVDVSNAADSNLASPAGHSLGKTTAFAHPGGDSELDIYSAGAAGGVMASQTIGATGGQPHTNIQPYAVPIFIIALTGVFPPRS